MTETDLSHIPSVSFWYFIKEGWVSEIQVSGLLRIHEGNILLEYQLDTDNFNKAVVYLRRKLRGSFTPTPVESGDILFLEIPISEMDVLEINTRFFSSVALLLLKTKTLQTLKDVPGSKGGTLELQFPKKDIRKVKKWIAAAKKQIQTS